MLGFDLVLQNIACGGHEFAGEATRVSLRCRQCTWYWNFHNGWCVGPIPAVDGEEFLGISAFQTSVRGNHRDFQ